MIKEQNSRSEINRLVNENFEWAKLVSRKTQIQFRFPFDKEDCESAGLDGLLRAAKQYDIKIGTFRSYAYRRVRGQVIDWAQHEMGKVVEQFHSRGRVATRPPMLVTDNIDSITIYSNDLNPEDILLLQQRCNIALRGMSFREQQAIIGLTSGYTLKELGKYFNVTESMMFLILKEARQSAINII